MLLRLPRRLLHPLPGAAVALAVLLGAGTASAQQITIGKVDRKPAPRQSTYYPTWINYADCMADGTITFTVTLPSPAWQTDPLQVWVGTGDCTDPAARTGSSPSCWEVYNKKADRSSSFPVVIRMRDIVARHLNTDPSHGAGSGIQADCKSSDSSPTAVTLNFMLISPGSDTIDPNTSPAQYNDGKFSYDLLGPAAPTKVKTGIAEKQLKVTWDGPSTDVVGYYIFCDPKRGSTTPSWNGAGGTSGTGGASATGGTGGTSTGGSDAGSVDAATESGTTDAAAGGGGAGGTTSTDGGSEAAAKNPNCPSTVLIAGQRPDPAYLCGTRNGGTTTSGYATGLTNGTNYAVAVAGFDKVQNYGLLSEVQCGTPQPVNDFWDEYTQAGGKGGGGFCGLADRPAPGAGGAFLLALFAGFLRRRRRQRS